MIKPGDGACKYDKIEELAWDYMFVGSCLTEEQDAELKKKWEEAGGYNAIPWWKFIMENVKIELDVK